MSAMPAGEYPASTAAPARAMTYSQLESRLMRLEQLERSDAEMQSARSNAASEPTAIRPRTSVLFSDEPCEDCGGRHEWSRVRATPTRTR